MMERVCAYGHQQVFSCFNMKEQDYLILWWLSLLDFMLTSHQFSIKSEVLITDSQQPTTMLDV